ncbi:MAG: TonB-dependent receptor [Paludibacter sp.]|nr:TonB-dependent receptor [Paludibacter sp.]
MRYKLKLSIVLIVVVSLCFNTTINAQKLSTDSVIQKQDVTIAYGVQPLWMVSGAISTVKGTDIQGQFTPNFTTRLQGKLPGLTVVTGSTEPGNENMSIYGRGINTFGVGGRQMLVLIDGVQGNYDDLTDEEVESVSLLKDASATAIYGARGANGVLLVTTKRGESGKLKVVFSTQHGLQSASSLPKLLGSYDYARLYNEASLNDGKSVKYTQTDLDKYQDGSDPYFHPNVNWYNEVLRKNAPMSNYNLNFTGGNSAVKYYVMLNQQSNSSLYKNTSDMSEFSVNGSYRRVNFRSNVDINLNKTLSAAVTIGGTVVDQANPGALSTYGTFNTITKIAPNAFPVYNPNGTFSRNQLYSNPLGDLVNNGKFTSNGRTLQTTVGLTQKLDMLTKGLSASARVSFNSYFLSQSNLTRTYSSFQIQEAPGTIAYTPFGISTGLVPSEGASDQYRNTTFQGFLNYDRTFGKHAISAMTMYNQDTYTISGDNFPNVHMNVSGRATYAYDQRYIAEVSMAYMGSEKYPGKKFGYFPAVSLGWIVSNESFLKGNKALNFLKLRGSYGLVGNDQYATTGSPRANAFMYEQYYNNTSSYYFGDPQTTYSSLIQGSAANPNVTWEKEKSMNIGVEATLFKDFNVSLDIFNRDRYDILIQPNSTSPDFMGYAKPYLNQGKANNQGFEAKVAYSKQFNPDFKFYAEATVWSYNTKIVYSAEAINLFDYQNKTGKSIDQPFGLVATGFFKDVADIAASPKQNWTAVQPGDVKYVDQNDDKKIDANDAVAIGGSYLPNLTAGLRLGAQYKGFDLDLFFQGVSNRTVSFGGNDIYAFQNNGTVGEIALNRWTPTTAATATYPRLSTMNNDNNYRYSTLWIRDGSFIKLRDVEIGYTLPTNISNKLLMSNVRFFLNGTNLLAFDKLEGFRDAEIGIGYPATKSVSIGLKVQFK